MLRQGGLSLRALAEIALGVAQEAGKVALGGWRKPHQVAEKGVRDLVTEADFAAEHVIRARLAELTPDIPVIGEEEGGVPGGEAVWYCDPIDGTTNYAHGHPIWAVSIGLMHGEVALAGAVVAPAIAIEWTGWRGGPALRNGETCRVSRTPELGRALVGTGFPRERDTEPDNNFASFASVKKSCRGVRRCGSAAIDLCFVADGTYDGYWERRLNPWDTAAGAAIVEAAGGRITHLDGGPPRLGEGNLVASNGLVHEELRAVIHARR